MDEDTLDAAHLAAASLWERRQFVVGPPAPIVGHINWPRFTPEQRERRENAAKGYETMADPGEATMNIDFKHAR